MAIRITGMYSGLDTESIINELASAQSYKKNKLVKAQTKLSWKQDAWKSLNTKIYSFYQKLDDLRLQASYLKKKTVVSNPNALQVTGGTVDGTHKVSVERLSQRATVTSGSLAKGDTHYTGNATLKQLGFTGSGSIRLSDNNGAYVDIDVNENMRINDFVSSLEKNTALTASFDQENQRIYLSSWTSGEQGNFYLSGNDAGGMNALKALKLLSTNDIDKLTASGGEYDVWSKYERAAVGDPPTAYDKLIEEETLNRLKALKAQNDKLAAENKNYDKYNQDNKDTFEKLKANENGEYDAYQAYIGDYDSDWDLDDADDLAAMRQAKDALFDMIYGPETTRNVQEKNEDGSLKFESDGITPVYVQAKDEEGNLKFEGGNPVYETETVRTGGLAGELNDLKDALTAAQDKLKQLKEDGTATADEIEKAEKDVADASEAVSKKQNEIDKAKEVYSVYSAFDENQSKKNTNKAKIDANDARFSYDEDTKTYKEKDASGAEVAIGRGITANEVTEQFDKKVAVAKDMMDTTDPTKQAAWKAAASATKLDGEDALIKVDGVTYMSSNDSLTVNGLSITALEVTDKDVTVSTKNDTEGVYNMIKDFIKAYSELINEMDSLYNAESAKDYEPLLTEEKEALSDTEIEEWEKKIKDSLLRRDSTLRDISSALKMDMMAGFNIGGQKVYLSDFGIATLGYFNSADNEKNAYHIDGDPDDAKTKNNDDLLTALINKDPDKVMEFFTNLTNTLHDTLQEKMSATKMSSAMTFYNDKKMKEDYDDYTDKIKKQEEKLNAYIDNWYAKFSKMETALSKLESKNSSLSSLFGG
ncbi:MAG: flagellar filament capping protein FliD [Lachnospiraceae bacterium]|nr:flagellar filament capping protein FliD [Lachnospiraceae bacterium]